MRLIHLLKTFIFPILLLNISQLELGVAALQPIEEAPLAQELRYSCYLNNNGSRSCTYNVKYTILKHAGINQVSKLDFQYSERDTFKVKEAKVISPQGKAAQLTPAQIDTRMAPNPREGFIRHKQTSLAFPNLEVGSQILYTVHYQIAAPPLLGPTLFDMLGFPPENIRLDYYKMEFTANKPILWRAENMDGFSITASKNQKKLKIERSNPYYFSFINELGSSYIRKFPRLMISHSTDIQEVFGKKAELYTKVRNAPLPKSLHQVIDTAKSKTPEEQVAIFMQYIHDYYHYMGDWKASTRGYVPFSLEKITAHRYGDCKDLSILLVALLNAVGIEADPVLVHRGISAPPFLLANLLLTNHAIVRAKIGPAGGVSEQIWWLDPTNPVFLPGHIPFDIQDRWAILLENSGKVSLLSIPQAPIQRSIAKVVSYRILPDSNAKIRFKGTINDELAMQVSNFNRIADQSATKKRVCSAISNLHSDCQVTLEPTKFLIPKKGYQIQGTLNGQKVVLPIGSGKFLLNSEALSLWKPYEKYLNEKDQGDLYLGLPNIQETIHIFENIKISGEQPKNCQITSPWFDLTIEWLPTLVKKAKAGIIYKTRLVQKVTWLSHQEITSPEFKTFLSKACACTKEKMQAFTLGS